MIDDDLIVINRAYFKLLTSIDRNDQTLVDGLREGLTKFLSNAYLKRKRMNKYRKADLWSKEAAKKRELTNFSGLIFEHAVPKQKYLQSPCEELARKGQLTEVHVMTVLEKYWKIAVITVDENKRLQSHGLDRRMPSDWDGVDSLARHKACVPPIEF